MQLISIITVLLVGQECLSPLNPFEVLRKFDETTGYTHTTGGIIRDNHKISLDYYDNRSTIFDTFHTYGSVILENTSPEEARYIKYRQKVSIPNGEYEIEWTTFSSMTFKVCPFNGNYILSKKILRGGEYFEPMGTYQWDHYVHIIPSTIVGDINNDGCVSGADLGLMIALWGTDDPVMDINGDGIVDGGDIGLLIANFSPPDCVPGEGDPECPYETTEPFRTHSIPCRIEAEDYDKGCEGYAFHDVDEENIGGEYRNDPVDIEIAYDTEQGYNVGWIRNGEWIQYTIQCPESREYTMTMRVAKATPDSTFRWFIDEVDVTGPIELLSTGGWHEYIDLVLPPVYIEEGTRVIKVYSDDGDWNFNWVEID